MKQIIPFVIITFFCIFFLVLHAVRPPGAGKPGILRRIWRWLVNIWDFITGFG
jgi:hypothetical protein